LARARGIEVPMGEPLPCVERPDIADPGAALHCSKPRAV